MASVLDPWLYGAAAEWSWRLRFVVLDKGHRIPSVSH